VVRLIGALTGEGAGYDTDQEGKVMADVGETLIEKKVNEPWQIKEALIVIPFLASALALTWEIGFFARIREERSGRSVLLNQPFLFNSVAENISSGTRVGSARGLAARSDPSLWRAAATSIVGKDFLPAITPKSPSGRAMGDFKNCVMIK
jgi:hypothetical protein